ncbi:MAG: hypothetical protein JWM53_6024, partial [bacterium]|nr:hypothetical protein [bacterium]
AGRGRARGLLLIGEIALAMLLCVGAALTLRSFSRLSSVDPGFDPHDVLTASLALSDTRYPDRDTVVAFYRELEEQLRALPGARSAALSVVLPLGGGNNMHAFKIDDRPTLSDADWQTANTRFVSADYFKVMGMGAIRGRTFVPTDEAPNAVPTVVINETAARKWWPHEDPIGQHVTITTTPAPSNWLSYEIVGIVPDVKFASLASPADVELYTPFAVTPFPNGWPGAFHLFALARGPHATALAAPLRVAVQAVDSYVPVTDVKTMDAYLTSSLSRQRWSTVLLGIFGALALLLAAVGVYGVTSYNVSQRTRELGIRMALGAQRSQVLRMVLMHGLRLTLIGVALGTAGAMALTRVLESQLQMETNLPQANPGEVVRGLYGISATDPPTFVGIALLLIAAATMASFLPARRATRVDPMLALRGD